MYLLFANVSNINISDIFLRILMLFFATFLSEHLILFFFFLMIGRPRRSPLFPYATLSRPHAVTPDPYRGPWGRNDPAAGKNYAADVKSLIDYATSGQIAAFIAESIQGVGGCVVFPDRSEEHTSELQSPCNLVCRLLLEKKK